MKNVFYSIIILMLILMPMSYSYDSDDSNISSDGNSNQLVSSFSQQAINDLVQFDEKGKIDIINHFKDISFIRAIAYRDMTLLNSEKDRKSLIDQISEIDQYQDKLIKVLIDSENNYRNSMKVFKYISNLNISSSKLDGFLYFPLINPIAKSYVNLRGLFNDKDLNKIVSLNEAIEDKMNSSFYDKILADLKVKDEDLITISGFDGKSVKVLYYDKEKGKILTKFVFPGSIIGKFKVRAVYNDKLVLFNLKTHKSIEKNFKCENWNSQNNNEVGFDLRKQYRVVPWFGESFIVNAKKGGKIWLYVKVIDEKGLTLKNAVLNLDGYKFKAYSNGMIRIPLDTNLFSTTKNTFTVSMNEKTKADFTVNIDSRDMFINYTASLGVNLGVGIEPLVAGATVAVKPACSGTILFVAKDIENKWKDSAVVTIFPSLTGTFSASLGPKLKPLDVHVMSHNLGVGAGATIGFNASATLGFSKQYMLRKPYTTDRKTAVVLGMDKLMSFTGPFKPIMSSVIKKVSGVNIKDHEIYAGLSVHSDIGINGNIGGTLGLVKLKNNGEIDSTTAGVSGSLISGSANLGMGVEGGILSGFTVFGTTTDKYNVVLKSNLGGNFSALKVSSKILGHNLIPEWFLVDVNGSLGSSIIFRFNKQKEFTKAIIVFTAGYKFKNNSYNRAYKYLKKKLEEDNAPASAYREIRDIRGMTKVYIFVIDRKKAQKYLREWVAFSRTILTERNPQNEQTVTAKVKGLFGVIGQSFRKLASTPVLFIEKTDLTLKYYTPSIGIKLSAGIKLDVGIDTTFTKSKSYVDRIGYFSNFKVYETEKYGYTKDIAKSNRSLKFFLDQVGSYIKDEVKDSASYVFNKAKDGTVYVAQKLKDGSVYIITIAANGTVNVAKKVGKAAKDAWNYALDTAGNAAEYVYNAGSSFANGVSDVLIDIYNWF